MANLFKVSIDSLLLDRLEVVLDVSELTLEQIDILGILIAYFRKSNSIGNFYEQALPEAFEMVKEYLDKKID